MKNTILTLVMAISITGIAKAEDYSTTLYGSVRLALEYNSTGGVDGGGTLAVVNTKSSRFGIKGNENLGNGLTAIYKYEFGVNANTGGIKNNDRLSYVGLTGNFGTFAIGRQWSPFWYATEAYNDIFNGSSSHALYLGPYRLSDMIHYSTSKISGFTADVAVIVNGTDISSIAGSKSQSDYLDAYNISAKWVGSGLTIASSYLQTNGTNDVLPTKLLGGVIGYKANNFQLGFVFVDKIKASQTSMHKVKTTDKDIYSYDLTGAFKINDADILSAGVALVDSQANDINSIYQYEFGYQHNFSKRTRVWSEYAFTDNGESVDNNNLISLGMRTDF